MQLKSITMKKYFIIVLNTILLANSFCCNAINETTSTKTKINTTPPDSRTKILGIWYRDEDRTAYWEFKNDGKVYCYSKGVLEDVSTFSISHSCGGNSDPKFEFLKLIDEDGSEYCSEINGINEDNSGILSLTSMQNFRIALFVNDVNITIPK
jgi:hypothetical protein